MAKVPTYESRASLQPVSNVAATAGQGEMIQEAAKGLEGIAQYFEKIKTQQETLSANTELDKALRQINFDTQTKAKSAKTTSEIDGFGNSAQDEITKAISETSGKISNLDARQAFMTHAEVRANRASTILSNFLMKQQLDLHKETLFQNVDGLTEEYIHSADPGERNNIKSEIKQNVMQAISNGGISRLAGYEYLNSHMNKMAEMQHEHDLELMKNSANPQTLYDNIKKNITGDPELNDKQKIALQTKADSMLKYNDNLQKAKQQHINHIADKELTWKYINGTLTKDDVMNNYDKMTPERAVALIKGLDNSNIKTNPHAKEYNEMMDYITDPKNSERDCIDKLLKYETSGKLTKKEAESLTHLFYIPTDKDPVFKVKRMELEAMLKAQEEKNGIHKSWIEKLGAWWKSLPFNKEQKSEIMQRVADAKVKDASLNTGEQDLPAMAEREKQRYVNEHRPDLNSIPAGKVKRTSDGKYGVKTDTGWRDATTEEKQKYNQEYGIE
jgi:hypothetical protein